MAHQWISCGGDVSRPKTSLGDGFKWKAGGVLEAMVNPANDLVALRPPTSRGLRDEVGGHRLTVECKMCRTHPVHQQAITALVTEVNRWPLTWGKNQQHERQAKRRRTGGQDDDDDDEPPKQAFSVPANTTWATDRLKPSDTPPVPSWCNQLVYDAVESVAIAGYFAYRMAQFEGGMAGAVVVPPEQYMLQRTHASPAWKTNVRGLTLVMVHPPRHDGVRSSASASLFDTIRYICLERNIVQRDTRNSEHTVYTSISSDLRNQNGSTRQWFRSTVADEAAGARPEIDTDFKQLIDRRADMSRRLTQHTREERQNLLADSTANRFGVRSGEPPSDPNHGRTHHEHIITDGKEYAQSNPLQSLTDGKSELDRVYTNIMLAYNVPPQIYGKNVNTERHAASNRLTESAVQIYAVYAGVIRQACALVVGNITREELEGKFFVGFKPVLDQGVLTALAPALTPAFVATSLSDIYGVPTNAVVLSKVCDVVGGLYTGEPDAAAKPAPKAKSKPADGPHKSNKHGAGPAKVNRKEAVD
jgi:hypothetical protein